MKSAARRLNNVRVVKAEAVVYSSGKKRPEGDFSPAVSSTQAETPHPRIAVCARAVRTIHSKRPLTLESVNYLKDGLI